MTLYQIIHAIMNASGKNEKRDVLRAHADLNADLKAFLKATYDPRICYYMQKVPPTKSVGAFDLNAAAINNVVDTIAGRKITGSGAKKWMTNFAEALTRESQALLTMMLAHDIRAGIAENSVLEVFPGLFYVPPYQRCKAMDPDLKERFGQMPYFYVDTKSDGQFCYAINRRNGDLQAMTRAGTLHADWIAEHITAGMSPGYVAMGELLVYRKGVLMPRKDGNGVLNSLLTGDGSKFIAQTDSLRFLAWDMVTEEEFDAGESVRPYKERKFELIERTTLDRVPSWVVSNVRDANRIQQEHVARGEEGTVWKNPDMGWRDCQSGDKDMMKAKLVFEADYVIRGYYEGKGKAKGMLGGLELASSDDLIEFGCGTGFSDEQRKELWAVRDTLPGQIVAAEGNDIVTSKSKPGKESIFLPAFIEVRKDKKVADSRDRVWEQFKAAKMVKADAV